MADIGTPFSFANPARHDNPPFPSSFSLRTHASLPRPKAYFSRFLRLPAELRSEIIRLCIQATRERRKKWIATQGSPLVLQSRRGVLRVQLQNKQPPSLAQLACVSLEWQKEIERQLFKTLRLRVVPDSRPGEYSDLVVFSAIVTGPRRRYLAGIRLDSYREYPTYRRRGSKAAMFYRTGGSYECIVRLFQTLATWAQREVPDDLLVVKLDIELQDFPLHHLREEIIQLPTIACIGALHINMEHIGAFSKLPLALLCLLRKLPHLRSAKLYLSPWCFLRENDRDNQIQELMRGFCIETPHLTELELTHPVVSRQTKSQRGLGSILTGPPISSIREISYRLKWLLVGGPIDLSLFFEYFHDKDQDVELASRPSWPHLEGLTLEGPIVKGSNPMRAQEKDAFLKAVGRAIRHMPRLKCACIVVDSQRHSSVLRPGMVIAFAKKSYLGQCHQHTESHRLLVCYHTPSRSTVRVWQEAFQYTKRMNLAVEFQPAPSFDENGNVIFADWKAWKD